MKEKVWKFLPIVIGLVLGWLLFHPPEWLSTLGVVRYVVMAIFVFILFIAFVVMMVAGSLPANVRITPAPDIAVTDDLSALAKRYRDLGFSQAGRPLRVEIAPPATLLPFVHEQEQTYGTVYRTGTLPAKTSFDFVSILKDNRGGLTTTVLPQGAALPAGAGELRQVFPGATIEELFHHHCEAVAYLGTRGLPCKQVSADSFIQDIKAGIAYQRKTFFSSPFRNAIISIWRSVTKRVPHIGQIQHQHLAAQQIQALITGRHQ